MRSLRRGRGIFRGFFFLFLSCSGEPPGGTGTPELVGIEISPATGEIRAGESLQLYAFGNFEGGGQANLTTVADWNVSDSDLASVELGLVTGLAPGEVEVSATFQGLTAKPASIVIAGTGSSVSILSPLAQKIQTLRGDIDLLYVLYDEEGDPMDIFVEYSTDLGKTFFPATPGPGSQGTQALSSAPYAKGGKEHLFVWDSASDVGEFFHLDVIVRITPAEGKGDDTGLYDLYGDGSLFLGLILDNTVEDPENITFSGPPDAIIAEGAYETGGIFVMVVEFAGSDSHIYDLFIYLESCEKGLLSFDSTFQGGPYPASYLFQDMETDAGWLVSYRRLFASLEGEMEVISCGEKGEDLHVTLGPASPLVLEEIERDIDAWIDFSHGKDAPRASLQGFSLSIPY